MDSFNICERENIPLVIIVGQEEFEKGEVKLRQVEERSEHNVKIENLVEKVKSLLAEIDLKNGLRNL